MTRQCLHGESVPGGGREGPLRRSGHSGRQLDRGRRGEMASGARVTATELSRGWPGSGFHLSETPVRDSRCLQSLGVFLLSFSSFSVKQ